jgi:hypothetical protein
MLRDSEAKIVAALVKLAQQSLGSSGRNEGAVSLGISPMELSARVGLDVDTVKRNVQELREAGYLRIVEERVEIANMAALRELFGLLGVKEQIVGGEGPREGSRRPRNARG